MTTPSHPAVLNLPAGNHALCACGLSKNGPYCDGSHQGTDATPHILKLEAAKAVYLCNCGASSKGPFCDGSHIMIDAAPTPKRSWWKFWA